MATLLFTIFALKPPGTQNSTAERSVRIYKILVYSFELFALNLEFLRYTYNSKANRGKFILVLYYVVNTNFLKNIDLVTLYPDFIYSEFRAPLGLRHQTTKYIQLDIYYKTRHVQHCISL